MVFMAVWRDTYLRYTEVIYSFIMQLIENLPCNIGLIMRSGIIPAWHCSCVSVISQCLLKLYHRLIGCTVTFHVISTFDWLNDVTVARKRA